MKKLTAKIALILLWVAPIAALGAPMSDTQVRQQMIEESIAAYPGNCPCPYNRARNGSRCGRRSAWSRPGGAAPLCFSSDISDRMVKRYRQRHALEERTLPKERHVN